MADESTTEETQVVASDTSTAAAETADTEAFDKDRAMATIAKLRGFEKEAAKAQKRLAELEAAEKARADAELSESDRLKKELAELKAQHKQAATELQRARLLDAARRAAEKATLVFHPGALEDAHALGVFDALEWNDKGEPLEIGKAVRELATARPYLLKPAAQSADLDGQKRGGTTKEEESVQRAAERRSRWGIRTHGA